jgi:acetyl esterase/lipase
MLLIHGDKDYLIPADQSDQMAAALARAGVRHQTIHLPEEGHGFGLVARGHDLSQEILAFLTEAWNHEGDVAISRAGVLRTRSDVPSSASTRPLDSTDTIRIITP